MTTRVNKIDIEESVEAELVASERVYVGKDQSNGYFYSDSTNRTAFTGGNFYLQTSVPTFFNYAGQTYHGQSGGTDRPQKFTNNTLSGEDWSISGSTGKFTTTGAVSAYSMNAYGITASVFTEGSTTLANKYLGKSGGTMTGKLALPDSGYSLGNAFQKWATKYTVKVDTPKELLSNTGGSLNNGGVYKFTAHISGTGTDQFATAVYWNQNGTWRINVTGQSGTSSNHPQFILDVDSGKPTLYSAHSSNYTVDILAERIELTEGGGTDNAGYAFGTDAYLGSTAGSLYFSPNGHETRGWGVYNDGNIVWHSGNFGKVEIDALNVDADTLDGYHHDKFGKLTGNQTWSGSNIFSSTSNHYRGHLYYDEHSAGRHYFHYNSSASTNQIDFRIGISGNSINTVHSWKHDDTYFATPVRTSTQGTLWGSGNDGAGSGLDADTIQGVSINKHVATGWANVVGKIPVIAADGRIELGRYTDFKTTNSNADYDIRFDCESANVLNIKGGSLEVEGNTVHHNGNFGKTEIDALNIDADTLDGYNAEEGALTNSIVKRDGTASIKALGLSLMRETTPRTGISWYNESYYNWQDYMAKPNVTGCGPNGNITSPVGLAGVTSWALRSRVEGNSTYGWNWESGSGGSGSALATSKMSLNATTGNLEIVGGLTAATGTFSGDVNVAGALDVNSSSGISSTGWVHLQRYATDLNVAIGNNGSNVDLLVPNGDILVTSDNPYPLVISKSTSGGGVGIKFTDIAQTEPNQHGFIDYFHQDGSSYGSGNAFVYRGDQPSMSHVFDVGTNKDGMQVKVNGAAQDVHHDGNFGKLEIDALNVDADTLDGLDSEHYKNNGEYNFKDIIVGGDADTYYPITIGASDGMAFGMYSISRKYNWTAPSTWYSSTHEGGLTLTWRASGDGEWGGNDKAWRVEQFDETYSNTVGGMDLLKVGMTVWLRGGTAAYRITTPRGASQSVTNRTTGFNDLDGVAYVPYTNNTLKSQVYERFPVRDDGRLHAIQDVQMGGKDLVDVGRGRFQYGTQSAPSITFEADNDTGFYHYATNQIGVTVGNDTQLRFSAGNYGLNMHSSMHLNDNHVNFAAGLHFNSGARFFDFSSAEINFAGAANNGGLRFTDASQNLKGKVYWSGTGFGLINPAGQWGVVTTATQTNLYHQGNAIKLETQADGIKVNGKVTASDGMASIKLTGATNFDELDKTSGFYNLYSTKTGSTNPPPFSYGTMIVVADNAGSTFASQMAIDRVTAQTYTRGRNDGNQAWTPYYETAHLERANSWTAAQDFKAGIKQDGHSLLNGIDTWFRTKDVGGIYFSTHEGGLHMTDSTWIRAYGGKKFYVENSSVDAINTNGGIQLAAGNNYGRGVTGAYSPTRFQGVFAMGSAYQLPADGTTSGNLYGIAWTHSNNTNTNGRKISGHHATFMTNGITRTAIGDHIWTNGDITSKGNTVSDGNITAKGSLYSENDLYLRTAHQRQVKIDAHLSFADVGTSCASGVHFKKTTSSPTIVAFGSHWNGATESITNAFVVGTGSTWYSGDLLKLTGTGSLTVAGDIYSTGTYYYGDTKKMFQFNDAWLRINPTEAFTSGIYCGQGKLRTDGQFEVGNGGDKFKVTSGGTVTAAGTITGTDCIATSDSRVKDNIAIIEDASGKLDKLSGNTFNRVDMDGRLHAGVIAQEVQAVLPEAIFITDDEAMDDGKKLNVSTSAMIGLLVQGHKEQAEKIAKLEKMVELLMGGK